MATNISMAMPARMKKRRIKIRPGKILLYVLLISSSLVMLYPLLVMILGSMGSQTDYYDNPAFPIPFHFTIYYYQILLNPEGTDFLKYALNTMFRIVWYLVITGYTSVVGGYVFSKLRWKGRDGVFSYMLSSMVLPGIVYMVPTYVMLARWPLAGGNDILGQGGHGFVGSWGSLLITGLVSVYYIFMFRQTLGAIPIDFEEAARVDGATTLQVLYKIYLPMLKPVFVVLFLSTFIGLWNDYMWPLMVLSGNTDLAPIALGFQYLGPKVAAQAGLPQDQPPFGFQFAVGIMSVSPCILLFLLLQRWFVEGVSGFAIKG